MALDRAAIARICHAHGVSKLSVFGSAVTERFDSLSSDIDLLVEFVPGSSDAFESYFGLKEDLEALLGRQVDLVMSSAVLNPHFAASVAQGAEEIYAA